MPSNADIEHALKCVDRIERGCARLDDTMDIRTCLAAYLTDDTNQDQVSDTPAGLTPREKRLVEAGRAMRATIYGSCERREAAAEAWSALITELTNEVIIATACDEVTT